MKDKVMYTDMMGARRFKQIMLERIMERPLNENELLRIEINTIKQGVWKISKRGIEFESKNTEGYVLQRIE